MPRKLPKFSNLPATCGNLFVTDGSLHTVGLRADMRGASVCCRLTPAQAAQLAAAMAAGKPAALTGPAYVAGGLFTDKRAGLQDSVSYAAGALTCRNGSSGSSLALQLSAQQALAVAKALQAYAAAQAA